MMILVQYALVCVYFLLLIFVFNESKKQNDFHDTHLRRSFFLLNFLLLVWLVVQISYDNKNVTALNLDILARVGSVTTLAMGMCVYYLSKSLTKKVSAFTNVTLMTVFVLGGTLAFMYPGVTALTKSNGVSFKYDSIVYGLQVVFSAGWCVFGLYQLTRVKAFARKHTLTVLETQTKAITKIVWTGLPIVLSGNYLIPLIGFGNASFIPTLIGPLYVVTSFGYVIFSLHMLNFRRYFYRTFFYTSSVIALSLLCATTFGFIILTLVGEQPLKSMNTFEAFGLLSFYSVFVVVAYIFSEKFIQRTVKGLDIFGTFDSARFYEEIDEAQKQIEIEDLIESFAQIIKKYLRIEKVGVVSWDNEVVFKTQSLENVDNSIFRQIFSNRAHVKLLDDDSSDYYLHKHSMATYNKVYAVEREGVQGLMFIGHKLSGKPLYPEEAVAVSSAVTTLELALDSAIKYSRIRNFNVQLTSEITQATRRLTSSNTKLLALDKAKDEFVSMASHQLRTPLTTVKGYVSMLLDGDAGPISPMQRQLLTQAYFSSQRMVYLIADLLNVSRLQTGKFVIEKRPINMSELVKGEIDQLNDTAKLRGIRLTLELPEGPLIASIDDVKVRQVVMNFTDNALYYTPTGGAVHIKLEKHAKFIRFTVKDTGMGVPKAEQHKLFEKFYRAGNARKARPDGTGLGLFMAKKVIIAQKGSLIFSSTEGKGSTFGFDLPL
jgi:signal transduction histidine kinase